MVNKSQKFGYPYSINLKIANTVIQMRSHFATEHLKAEEKKFHNQERFNCFLYRGKQKPHILIDVRIVDKLYKIFGTKPVFITYHFQDGKENWRLLKKNNNYIYRCPLNDKKQLMLVNDTFDHVTAYVLPRRNKGKIWNIDDIIYDFLQVLLINYFSQKNRGVLVHSVGIKDLDGKGLLFVGKSGSGKSTTARLWDKHSRAMILNDDRIIIRKTKSRFFIYGSPWHGDFSDYLTSRIESAPLVKLFFIHHSPDNIVRKISQKEAFSLLYPNLFPAFWDKESLENNICFCQNLVKAVPCFRLGFKNDKRIIEFVRKI